MKSVNFCVAGFAAGRNPIAQGETLNYNENLALIELQNYSELQWENELQQARIFVQHLSGLLKRGLGALRNRWKHGFETKHKKC